ncbi:MAG: hypothetical protein KKA54_15440 [Proteobacteria bacterium]|nr:hypothetical protein [Pseudomonadota bacterium]
MLEKQLIPAGIQLNFALTLSALFAKGSINKKFTLLRQDWNPAVLQV